jgi:ubiquinone/menaquinone biosynthesis C-methylase UbiE
MLRRRYCPAVSLLVLIGALAGLQAQRGNDRNRDEWQKVPEIFSAMGIGEGSVVADIGAGRGFFTTRLARHVGPGGRVYAVDIDAGNVDRLKRLSGDDGLQQVSVVQGTTTDPQLPEGTIDAALVVNAYHEFTAHRAMLEAILRALKPDGRLVIVEPLDRSRRDAPRERQERSHEIGPQYVRADLESAGFEVVDLIDPFTKRPEGDEMWLVVARRAAKLSTSIR